MNIYNLLTKMLGWTPDSGAAPEKVCVILGAPHTSLLDFFIAYLYYRGTGHVAHIMVKKEFFIWPIKGLMLKLGCIPVDRSNGAAVIRSVISAAEKAEGEFHICIAPEGTRKPVRKWKMGYHAIAKALNCPVYLGYFNWGNKHVSIGEKFPLTDNARADTDAIQKRYEEMGLVGRHPEKYLTH